MTDLPIATGTVSIQSDEIRARRILVVAPHPDDESLGCGGLIHELARRGARFHILFVTDGGASHLNSASWPRQRLAAARESEALEALRRLGVDDHDATFLHLPDAAMPRPDSTAGMAASAETTAVLGSFLPDLVLLPWRRDPHCDHRDSWHLVTSAIAATDRPVTVWEYAIWLDEIGAPEDRPRAGEMDAFDFVLPEAAVAAKRHAVAAHRTQTGEIITDDPTAFRLTPETIDRLCGSRERYWRPSANEDRPDGVR
ncbi:PIG-L deacetylase family protein [Mangrovicella endophytica]|uniref:PIG-L deacetylase family protein n=1 Tax=Mangrovicella endophytica TaxID=2066697 RepID=UPI000C9DB9F0|nr:PIG-L family deacetylase [Mangrovicella endophytica]